MAGFARFDQPLGFDLLFGRGIKEVAGIAVEFYHSEIVLPDIEIHNRLSELTIRPCETDQTALARIIV